MQEAQNSIALQGVSGKHRSKGRINKARLIDHLLALPAADLRLLVFIGCLGFWVAVFFVWTL